VKIVPRLALVAGLTLPASGALAASPDAMTIHWKDLRPASQQAAESTGLPMIAAKMPDRGETLSTNLDGKTVTLTGYALPVDREGDLVYQFLLVPWTGACSHMPTPPPNQIVLVTMPKPYKMANAYETVSVTGTLKTEMEKSQLFILDGVSIIQSGYSFGKAEVAAADTVPDAVVVPQANPWSFMKK
jgi:hypothetical protein